MVEALSTGFQNLYNKYTRSENGPQDDGRCEIYIVPPNKKSANTVVLVDNNTSQGFQRYRPKARKSFEFDVKQLCISKHLKWQIMRQSRLRTSTGQCCPICIPVSIGCSFTFIQKSFETNMSTKILSQRRPSYCPLQIRISCIKKYYQYL